MENLPSNEVRSEESKPPAKTEDRPKTTILDQIVSLLPLAGTVELTDKQAEILYATVDQESIEIRPDGLIYLPWMEYVTRLRQAFGMSWAHIPQGQPAIRDNHVMWGFWLIIQGKPYSFSVGDQEYIPTNRTMSYGDALEGAKSNALMRNCKSLGISLELWKPSFIRAWKEKYAERYKDEKGNLRWRKKNVVSNGKEESLSEPVSDTISQAQVKRFFAIAKTTGATDEQIKEWLYREYDIEHSKDIPKAMYDEICTKIKEDLSVKGGE